MKNFWNCIVMFPLGLAMSGPFAIAGTVLGLLVGFLIGFFVRHLL